MDNRKIGALLIWLFISAISMAAFAQQPDSVDVTFFYKPPGNPNIVYLPGEFNNWGNNVNGRITDPRFAMTKDPVTGVWSKTVRLRVGGPVPLPAPGKSIPGAYQYKFNENGSPNGWLPDPLNPRKNPLDNNNSYLFIHNPTIHYLLPNSLSGLIQTSQPEITAYLFPAISSTVDPISIKVEIDGTEYTDIGAGYNPSTHFFSFVPTEPLSKGNHTLKLFAESSTGTLGADSTTFMVQAGFIQLLTRPNDRHLRPTKNVVGTVEDPAVPITFIQNEVDTVVINAHANGRFELSVGLEEGYNTFKALATDSLGVTHATNTVVINYVVDHAPKPEIFITLEGSDVLILSFEGNDPDGDALTVTWTSDDEINPEPLGINSQDESVTLTIPQTPGEYFIDLVAVDPDSNVGIARSYFAVEQDGGLTFSGVNKNPQWVQDAIIYEIFVPAFTAQGTLAAAKERLPIIKSLGVNVIWLMPIYENGETINELNAGYNITDFFKIHPQLGTIADFHDFLQEAHQLGIRVILDTTPNHVSGFHPWVKDVELFRDFSNFRPFVEDQILGDNRGLGQFPTVIGDYVVYVHYSNWTLANLDYSHIETVDFMLNMYKYWVLEQGIDGYRMDVYWGPQNRYGKSAWWRPFREEMKRVRPDIFILSETDGTGVGSENNYADGGGASDAAYDWNFYNEIKNTLNGGNLNSLDQRVRNFSPSLNYNHFTGLNSHYLRFLENHDETRIAQLFDFDFRRTKAGAALLFTIPGIPLIYAGQEVGETSRRGKINWNRPEAETTFEFYQRLTAIRNTFSTFRSSEIKRISSGASRVYAYLRPQLDQNGIGVLNFSSNSVTATLTINETELRLSSDSLLAGVTYYLNDVLNDTAYSVTKATLSNFEIDLAPWGAAVLVFADSVINLVTSVDEPEVVDVPKQFRLFQNYPNPFNPSTTIGFELPKSAHVTLEIFNILGQKIRTLVDEATPAGMYMVPWDGKDEVGVEMASGVYIMRMVAGNFIKSMKLIKLK